MALGVDAALAYLPSIDGDVNLFERMPVSASAVGIYRSQNRIELLLALGVQVGYFLETVPSSGWGTELSGASIGPRVGIGMGYVWSSGIGIAFDYSLAVFSNAGGTVLPSILLVKGILATW